ncbi:MAG: SAM-dependent methyltransferase, partial [Christensenellales bacterium]
AKCDSFIASENKSRAMARQEITIKLSEVVNVASNLLKFGGVFYMVHQAKRLQEILVELNKNNLAVKELTFCQSKIDTNPHLVILKAVKGGKMEMIINRTLILNNEDGELTSEVMKLYSKTNI